MNKNFLEIKNVSFRAGGKTKVKNVFMTLDEAFYFKEEIQVQLKKNVQLY